MKLHHCVSNVSPPGEFCAECAQESAHAIDSALLDDAVIDALASQRVILCIGIYQRQKMTGGKMRVVDAQMTCQRQP